MDWIWIILGFCAVGVFTTVVITITILTSGSLTGEYKEKRPGYQDVLVRDCVDVRTRKYIHEAAMFPNKDGLEAFSTAFAEGSPYRWAVTLTDAVTGTRYQADFAGVLVLGRDPVVRSGESKLIISDSSVSKTHCRIVNRNSSLVIEDTVSRNGTFLNGKRLTGPAGIKTGDNILIGNTTLIISISKG